MKRSSLLINTSRGAVVETSAIIDALQSGQLGGYGADVYEGEDKLFAEDRSGERIDDHQFVRLRAFPNALITPHQGFFTREALANIAGTTIANLDAFEQTGRPIHLVPPESEEERIAPQVTEPFKFVT